MVSKDGARVAIVLIALSLSSPAHAQSSGLLLSEPGPIAISAARLVAEQSTKIRRPPRSRVRRASCAKTMMWGTGIGTGIGLAAGIAGYRSFEEQPEMLLAATGFLGIIGFAIGYRMC